MRKLAFAIVLALPALAQTSPTDWEVHAANEYRVIPSVTYLTASNKTVSSRFVITTGGFRSTSSS